ncbi:MAG: DNA polymerase III subunit epsilon [Alphaproteobacteria bacterium]|nr:DNA polymerase III subunit epsilon [Alphaproteobacteria bacterium]MCD8569956.1 DNA polymerase III subunit epsilon [Alphaproteobacteria bacterium]
MREIVLDTETTGMDPEAGDRIVEIGCVELENHIPTGKTLQLYINPEREVPAEAIAVHGITNEFLKDKPIFSQVYAEFVTFIRGAKLVIHNAEFDMKFINYQLKDVGEAPVPWSDVVDTLAMARRKFPGSPANLDALCRRFGVDNTGREYHGALLDSELLAEVYLELLGGRQHGLSLLSSGSGVSDKNGSGDQAKPTKEKPFREPRVFEVPATEQEAHAAMLEKIKEPLWNQNS